MVGPDLPHALEGPTICAYAHGVVSTILPVLGLVGPALLMAAASEGQDLLLL